MKKLEKYLSSLAIISFICAATYISIISTPNIQSQQNIKIKYIQTQKVLKITRCKNIGNLANIIATKVVTKVPLNNLLDVNDDADTLYIKIKAYNSIMLRLGETSYIPEFQTDMIISCLTGEMDD